MSDIIVSNFEREQRKCGRANDEKKKKVSGHCAYRYIYIRTYICQKNLIQTTR